MQPAKQGSAQVLLIFLGVWTIVNAIQACFVELHADEAYYWVYSRFLDWGYFDHPPMVALFIKAGDALLHSALGLRLVTVISSTLSVFLLWKIVSRYTENIKLFILLFSAVVLFHVYGFITTPDAPLFFFSVLFLYIYQRYTTEDKLKWAIILALVIACLLYSKYHGILLLFFTILSNLKLLKRPSFWLIVILSILAFLPHIWWQVQNNYPSFYYHVIDRSAAFYKFKFTSEYLLAQLALAGPLVGWFMYRSAVALPSSDAFIRAVKFNFYGIFAFFLISTFKGRVEAHWTLPAMLCLFILGYIAMAGRPVPKWFGKLAIINIAMVILVRLVLIIPVAPLMKIKVVAYYFGTEKWASQIREKAGESPVVFKDSFQVPSRYNYYTRSTSGFGYDSRYYRKNQYDIWPLEDSLRNKKVYYVLQESHGEGAAQDTIHTPKGTFYGRWLEDVRMYQKVTVNPTTLPGVLDKGKTVRLVLKISNPYREVITLGNKQEQWKCFLEYGYKKDGALTEFKPVIATLEGLKIGAGKSAEINATITAPPDPGKYKLILSIRTEPFPGARNNNMLGVEVR